MGKAKNNGTRDIYTSPFNKAWFRAKHAHSQVNGETQKSQNLIILENETRKRS
ncbi:hypothetical protein J2S13_002403 [Oikeobacillus pervagus]|uniref:YpzG family protein n=1 Tax=Oikeobacillus pervagus TaxID=1325931 RepID=A0AAJ1T3H7_9BACI|nr:YpzG family protein [Oikeobacillus pervagus]MDQ0215981.1 hypothetical protein [Oikeobacillus pervagus]